MINWKFNLKWRLGFIFLGFFLIGGSFLLFQLLGGADLLSGTSARPALTYYLTRPFAFFLLPVLLTWIVCGSVQYCFYVFLSVGKNSPAMYIITFLLCGFLWFYLGYGVGVLVEKKISKHKRMN